MEFGNGASKSDRSFLPAARAKWSFISAYAPTGTDHGFLAFLPQEFVKRRTGNGPAVLRNLVHRDVRFWLVGPRRRLTAAALPARRSTLISSPRRLVTTYFSNPNHCASPVNSRSNGSTTSPAATPASTLPP